MLSLFHYLGFYIPRKTTCIRIIFIYVIDLYVFLNVQI